MTPEEIRAMVDAMNAASRADSPDWRRPFPSESFSRPGADYDAAGEAQRTIQRGRRNQAAQGRYENTVFPAMAQGFRILTRIDGAAMDALANALPMTAFDVDPETGENRGKRSASLPEIIGEIQRSLQTSTPYEIQSDLTMLEEIATGAAVPGPGEIRPLAAGLLSFGTLLRRRGGQKLLDDLVQNFDRAPATGQDFLENFSGWVNKNKDDLNVNANWDGTELELLDKSSGSELVIQPNQMSDAYTDPNYGGGPGLGATTPEFRQAVADVTPEFSDVPRMGAEDIGQRNAYVALLSNPGGRGGAGAAYMNPAFGAFQDAADLARMPTGASASAHVPPGLMMRAMDDLEYAMNDPDEFARVIRNLQPATGQANLERLYNRTAYFSGRQGYPQSVARPPLPIEDEAARGAWARAARGTAAEQYAPASGARLDPERLRLSGMAPNEIISVVNMVNAANSKATRKGFGDLGAAVAAAQGAGFNREVGTRTLSRMFGGGQDRADILVGLLDIPSDYTPPASAITRIRNEAAQATPFGGTQGGAARAAPGAGAVIDDLDLWDRLEDLAMNSGYEDLDEMILAGLDAQFTPVTLANDLASASGVPSDRIRPLIESVLRASGR